MRWSSRWSCPALLLFAAVPVSAQTPATPTAAPAKTLTEPHDAADLYNSLRDVINYGAELFNKQADHAGCYRVYQGSLIAVRPFLTPEVRKKIDETIIRAETLPYYSERAFELRRMLDEIRSKAQAAKTAPKVAAAGKSQTNTAIAPPPQPAPTVNLPSTKPSISAPPTPLPALPRSDLPKIVESANPTGPLNPVAPPLSVPGGKEPTFEPKKAGPKVESPKFEPTPLPVPPPIDLPKVDPPKGTLPKVEAPKVELPKVELPEVELPKVNEKNVELPKSDRKNELPKVVPPPIDLPKVDPPKGTLPKVDLPKVDLPKVDLPKVELPKPELPKSELPKPGLPKPEPSKSELPKVVPPVIDPLPVIPPPIEAPKEKPGSAKPAAPPVTSAPGKLPPITSIPEPGKIEPPPAVELPKPGVASKLGKTEKGMVSGRISFEGKPLPAGFFVTLVAADGKRLSTLVQKEGEFQFTSGVLAGTYKIAIEPLPGDDGKLVPIPTRYRDEATSGLILQVNATKVTPELRLMR